MSTEKQENSIKNKIMEVRPNLSKQSVKTYTSILKNLFQKVFPGHAFDISKFDEDSKIIEHLKKVEPNKRKTILSALVIITNKPSYRTLMLEDISKYNEEQHKQVQNEKQNESWVDTDHIVKLYKQLEKLSKLIYKKYNQLEEGEELNMNELQELQNYIILSLLGGIYIPPRRSKDYVDFKIKNINKDTDNYFDKGKFIFNSYKTAKTYGRQEVEVPKELQKIIKKWIKVNPTDYLLFDSNKKQLSNVKLNQRINRLFDNKKVGVNQLRHTYLSDKYQETIQTNKNLEKDLQQMGSSKIQEKIYIKQK